MDYTRLIKNIVITILGYMGFQFAAFGTISWIYSVQTELVVGFYLASFSGHCVLMGFLIYMKDQFRLEPSGVLLNHINFANQLTLFRITSIPTISFLIIVVRTEPVAIWLLLLTSGAFISDLFDGILSRRTHQVTRIGKYMDSVSDYSALVIIAIMYVIFRIIPVWFFALLMFRLLLQAFFMLGLLTSQKIDRPETTFLGKATIFVTMTLFGIKILEIMNFPGISNPDVMQWIEYFVGAVVFASIFDKVFIFSKRVKEPEPPKNT